MSILDHIYIAVSDYERAKAFYMAALEPLGIELVMERGDTGAFGRGNRPELWIAVRSRSAKGCGINDSATSHAPAESPPITQVHVAVAASSRDQVDAFYRAAITAGGVGNGLPGLRPEYHSTYYGAFVIDPDGHNLESVFHGF